MGSLTVILTLIVVLVTLRLFPRAWLIFVVLLSKCWFPILSTVFAMIIFAGTPQGRDIISQIEFNSAHLRTFSSPIALWFWAYNCWAMSSTILDLVGMRKLAGESDKLAKNISTVIPLGIGLFPIAASLWIFTTYQDTFNKVFFWVLLSECWFFVIYILLKQDIQVRIGKLTFSRKLLNIFSLYVFSAYAVAAKLINHLFDRILKRETRAVPDPKPEKFENKEHWKLHMTGERFLNWTLHTGLFVLISLYPVYFAQVIGPFGLVFIALSWLVILGIGFAYLRKGTGQPMFKVLIIAIAVFTLVNDNNLAGVIDTGAPDPREKLEPHFEKWLMSRPGNPDTVNITLVAAEGGGLRSAYWTYGVLRQLQLDNPNFKNELYAISSVSGGSVGSAIFCSELVSGLSSSLDKAPIVNEDNLSPMIAGIFYRELAQSIIPYPVVGLDRSRVMDRTFEMNWRKKHPDGPGLEDAFPKLWNDHPDLPALFINTTHVETGKTAIFSNLKFDSTQIMAMDVMSRLRSSVKLSTAVGISSRVPIFQPGAKFDQPSGQTWGHLVDGGYSDNSGISVLYQLYLELRALSDEWIAQKKIKGVRFTVLFLANVKRVNDEPCTFLNELRTPVNALASTWKERGGAFERISAITISKINKNDRYFEMRLNREKVDLPLGWIFSSRSQKAMIDQLNNLHANKNYQEFCRRINK
jgi:predicted acylesterase/phospholipase RssA